MGNKFNLKAYSPYSNRNETCLVEGKSGFFYPGVRVENISFPLSISAVQAAVCSCLANRDEPVRLYQEAPESELTEYWTDQFNLELSVSLPGDIRLYDPVLDSNIHLFDTLVQLCEHAITIHSDFPVAALLETDKGYIPGANIEVSAWSLGLCAERVAISRALSLGIQNILGLHIYAPKGQFSSPCGACRQVLAEHMPDKPVELHHNKNSLSRHFTNHLLPYGFITKSLNK